MSWFGLNKAMGSNYTVDPGDIVNTKAALNQLGYYDVPPHRGIDDWTDDSMFNGIKAFQQDNGLKVDGLMRPGGPTEKALNISLAVNEDKPGLGEGETPPLGSGKGGIRIPGNEMPVGVPPNIDPGMPVLDRDFEREPGAFLDENGVPRMDGWNPKIRRIVKPPRGPF